MSPGSSSIFGPVVLLPGPPATVRRDSRAARWWARPLARWLAGREAAALARLAGDPAIPRLLAWDGECLLRSAIPGSTLREARPRDPRYFREALRALARMHRRGVAHNDLAREPNWLVTNSGDVAIIDFQLAWCDPSRGRLFRLMAREDLRHLLKHKRTYCPQCISTRQRRLLASRGGLARCWQFGPRPLLRLLSRALRAPG